MGPMGVIEMEVAAAVVVAVVAVGNKLGQLNP